MRKDVSQRNELLKAKNNSESLIGQKYNSLTIIGFEHRGKCWFWKCQCDCGKEIVAMPNKVRNGHTKTCGCGKVERCHALTEKYRITHAGRGERLYYIWRGMKSRCTNNGNKDFSKYGGRGISVCNEWFCNYANFREWALKNGYRNDLTIDRIDVNGNYCPENCRWITLKEQSRNKRITIYVTVNGVTKPLSEMCEDYRIKYQSAYGLIHRKGWEPQEAILHLAERSARSGFDGKIR